MIMSAQGNFQQACFWGLKNKHFWLRGCGPSLYMYPNTDPRCIWQMPQKSKEWYEMSALPVGRYPMNPTLTMLTFAGGFFLANIEWKAREANYVPNYELLHWHTKNRDFISILPLQILLTRSHHSVSIMFNLCRILSINHTSCAYILSHKITGIFTYICLIFMVSVGKIYHFYGSYGYRFSCLYPTNFEVRDLRNSSESFPDWPKLQPKPISWMDDEKPLKNLFEPRHHQVGP